jgi:multiple sugar transport system ATP-binding protein
VLNAGRIQHLATPLEIYTRPANRFVAEFIGSPSINMFEATRDKGGVLRLPDGIAIGELASGNADRVIVGVRPEDMEIRDDGQLSGRISLVEPTGPETYALVDLGHTEVTVRMSGLPNVSPGAAVRVHVPPSSIHVFAADSGLRLN